MDDENYKPHTFGLSIRIPHELVDDGGELQAQAMRDLCRMTMIRQDVEMGGSLNPDDAKWLLENQDRLAKRNGELQEALDAKPPPTLLWTLRAWLAQTIKPEPEDDDYDY